MYRKLHQGWLSIEAFHLPFYGILEPTNLWVLLAELIPWQELEETYAPQFSANVGAQAKHAKLAFGSLYIKHCLGYTNGETVLQIQENHYIKFFLVGSSCYYHGFCSSLLWTEGSQNNNLLIVHPTVSLWMSPSIWEATRMPR
jgi:hypothetical protein